MNPLRAASFGWPVTSGVSENSVLGPVLFNILSTTWMSAPSVSLQMTLKLGGSVGLLQCRKALQRDMD